MYDSPTTVQQHLNSSPPSPHAPSILQFSSPEVKDPPSTLCHFQRCPPQRFAHFQKSPLTISPFQLSLHQGTNPTARRGVNVSSPRRSYRKDHQLWPYYLVPGPATQGSLGYSMYT